jgi:hypothetical protein
MLDFNDIVLYVKHPTCKICAVNVVFVLCSRLYEEQVLPKDAEMRANCQIVIKSTTSLPLLLCEERKLESLKEWL